MLYVNDRVSFVFTSESWGEVATEYKRMLYMYLHLRYNMILSSQTQTNHNYHVAILHEMMAVHQLCSMLYVCSNCIWA